MSIVKLKVNGFLYSGWETINISTGIRQASAAFELTVNEKWQGRDDLNRIGATWKLQAGDACQVLIDDEQVISGFIDVHESTITHDSHSVSVSGRSRTADLVDCSAVHNPGNFVKQNILSIANSLSAPFDVETVLGDNVRAVSSIEKFELNNGESVFEAVERCARKQQLLVTDNKDGELVLDQASDSAYSFPLSGWESATFTADYSRRHSLYTAKAQQHGANFKDPLEAARVPGTVTDPAITRYRPLIVRPEGTTSPADALKRIRWQANRAIGESLRLVVTMTGFRDNNDDLWQKNRLINVYDETLGIDHQLLIESVRFSQSTDTGTTTELELVHPGAYAPEPVAQATNSGKRTAAKKSSYLDL